MNSAMELLRDHVPLELLFDLADLGCDRAGSDQPVLHLPAGLSLVQAEPV